MCNVSKRRREAARPKMKALGDHKEFLKRITKSLYYGRLPGLPCLSLPVTELSADLFSEAQRGRSLKRLHLDDAAEITRNACVSPCSLVLAILYLERLKTCNPEYLAKVAPSELFLVSLMVSNKFLQDDGEEDEVFCDEWAASGGVDVRTLKQLERNFLSAIDWKVYISENSFEAGLSWLERQIALKQANLRGFFTYADLAATSGDLGISELLKSFSSVCLAMTLSYITSLMTVFTSTLLISHSLLPSLHQHMLTSNTNLPATIDMNNNLITPNEGSLMDSEKLSVNVTIDNVIIKSLGEFEKSFSIQVEMDKVNCCSQWSRLCVHQQKKTDWYDSILLNTFKAKTYESWWSQTSITNWLYQTSLITPLQKWLDKLDQWSNLISFDILNYTQQSYERPEKCNYAMEARGLSGHGNKCLNPWLDMGKFSSLMVSVSDR